MKNKYLLIILFAYFVSFELISQRKDLNLIQTSLFDNIPYRRLKKSIFQLGGLKTKYLRFYSVLPNMTKSEFDIHMNKVKALARSL